MRKLALLLPAVAATALAAGSGLAAGEECEVVDRSTKEVLPGVTLTWARAEGLPMTVRPGASESVRVSGGYELVTTDEGAKANLHLRALGRGMESGDAFRLGINVRSRRG